jgi:hypothetical protein
VETIPNLLRGDGDVLSTYPTDEKLLKNYREVDRIITLAFYHAQ